jgi:hypothetical protein
MTKTQRVTWLTHAVTAATVAVVALACSPFATAQAMNPDRKTLLTFSAPIEVPGATLEAGKYMFKLADPMSSRHVVQIFNEDGSKLITTLLTIPDRRLDATPDPVVTFIETPAATPAAIKSWFYPGALTGDEFIYPKDQALRIARVTRSTVLAADTVRGDGIEGMRSAALSRVDAEGRSTAVQERAAARAEARTPPARAESKTPRAPAAPSAAAGTAGRQAAASDQPALPRTASRVPLVGLIGLLSLTAALSVRVFAMARN